MIFSREVVCSLTLSLAMILLILLLHPPILDSGDTLSYLDSITVLEEGVAPEGFTANRIVTGFLGLEILRFLNVFTGEYVLTWVAMNAIFLMIALYFFYLLVRDIFKNEIIGLLGQGFLAISYGIVAFALQPLMDIGGWAAFIMSAYFSYRYLHTAELRYILIAAAVVGVGSLFKEYALLGTLLIAGVLSYQHLYMQLEIRAYISRALLTASIALLPLALVSWWVYATFGYTYFNWLHYAQDAYGSAYSSRILEYSKVFGSFFHFGWFLLIPSMFLIGKHWREIDKRMVFFVVLLGASALPAFFWPAITQRFFTVALPALIIVALYPLSLYPRWITAYALFLVLYAATSFAMDPFILPTVNIDVFLNAYGIF